MRLFAILFLTLMLQAPLFAREQFNENNSDPRSGAVQYDFDDMIKTFRSKAGKVEITLFRKLRFDAKVIELPSPRKTKYLQQLLQDFGGATPPTVSEVMDVRSANGVKYHLYVVDELVAQVNELLAAGDNVTFYSYHAYNSPYGPGLVVYAFNRHGKRTLLQQTNQWLSDSDK